MMRGALACFWSDRRGAAAAEMAIAAPLLVVLMFGSFELGKFFWDQHIVVKAVRDGARFAARQSMTAMPCTGGVDPIAEARIRNLVRTGTADGTGTARLYYWTNPATITVTVNCYDNTGGGGATTVYAGVYEGMANVPRVTVSASVPYTPLVGSIGFDTAGISLNADNQATVFGI